MSMEVKERQSARKKHVPEGWSVYKINELLVRLKNPVNVKDDETYREIGIRSHGKGIFYKESITGKDLGGKSVFWIEPDCFIVNIVFAWEMAVAKTTNRELGFIASHRFPMYRPVESKLSIDFITHFFKSSKGKHLLKLASPGGAGRNKTLGQKEFAETEVTIPISVNEQKGIANVLSTWDEAIELKEKLIELKKEQRKGLMQKLLTGQIRWNDRERCTTEEVQDRIAMISRGEVPEGYMDTKAGILPEEWTVKKLKEISKRIQRKNEGKEDKPVLTISSLSGFLNQSDRFSKVIAGENLSKYTLIKKNEFAYNKGNSKTYPCGCIFRLEDYEEALVPNIYYSFQIVEGETEFYKHYFASGKMNRHLGKVINTGVRNDGLLNVDASDFFNIPVVCPPKHEQLKIAEVLTNAGNEIDCLEKEVVSIKEQKRGLMQLLLTGKLRVKV
ncbi:restriction endonuclease subunit S [Paenibacillus sp. FSL R5-0407]|uniref:restriction endonuclease subunit S n=1 Tax=Paenibacillus sp. FSL R5-0407 TaxID=2975320 RepID=UPI0030FBD060